ncbi:SDR family oxidoreductase [Pedobacter nyackensis]|uniref:NAD(P)-dependent dehydrogenase, short-chain alcohol dehydrogenase family n=1 Tax=Pedobacter nyackensis TaxID=475255 RepID=A0A1W2F2I1_9SPHI|nr:SDR family oxidoreductase [Pedobacter nyackensis]SMD16114.1 NAD(P)-dependent dehydrogenase, short-chain alcohol dehydrogenase family [Pedobacter nyackensis]
MVLKNKVIVVTGGTGVLGGAFVKGIHNAGGTVCILGRNLELAEQRAAEINNAGGKALALKADVLIENQLQAACDKIIDQFGEIHGLVNAAGGNTPGGIVQPADDVFKLNMDGLREVMELNLWGTLIPTQIFGEAIAKTGEGSIVNISSMASQSVITKVLGYTLAKTSIDAYTRWFAVEMANRYGDKLRMNAIAPGFFLTEQNRQLLTNEDGSYTDRGGLVISNTPFKRFGVPEELIGALVWLLGNESKFVTGTVINVDGGFSVFSGV